MKKEFYQKSLESNADFKSTCCENILSNLYSLINIATVKYVSYSTLDYLIEEGQRK